MSTQPEPAQREPRWQVRPETTPRDALIGMYAINEGDVAILDEIVDAITAAARAEVARQVRPGVSTADRALNLPHREDEPCACDDCMSYGAEDEGFDWYRIAPARRIVLRVLDSGDDRLAAIATAFREHEAALSEDPPQPEPETDPRVALHKAGGHAGATNRFCSLCNPSAAALLEDAAPRQPEPEYGYQARELTDSEEAAEDATWD